METRKRLLRLLLLLLPLILIDDDGDDDDGDDDDYDGDDDNDGDDDADDDMFCCSPFGSILIIIWYRIQWMSLLHCWQSAQVVDWTIAELLTTGSITGRSWQGSAPITSGTTTAWCTSLSSSLP